jgi:hypothetical protein
LRDRLFDPFRFGHAFYSKPDETKMTTTTKQSFCLHRAARVKWIEPIIGGQIENCEVYRVPPEKPTPASNPQRLYVYWGGPYIIWLTQRREQFEFSTAYLIHDQRLRAKIRHWKAVLMDWKPKQTIPPPKA